MSYILALDQGTSSSRALLFDQSACVVALRQSEFQQHYPQPGWVEHDAEEIWQCQLEMAKAAIKSATPGEIQGLGITNQRETTVIWDRKTGKPIHRALVWQDRRTSQVCKGWTENYGGLITQKTGLVCDAYFSASKICWLLDNIEGARARAEDGELAFGTIDSWLIWNLTEGRSHVTDVSNASRTMIFNVDELIWDQELLDIFQIPRQILPEVRSSSETVGTTTLLGGEIPISGIAGDQQSALFGQLCQRPGTSKNTYGTGCFMLLNTGQKRKHSENRLLSTVAWQQNGQTDYALEGSVFVGGAAVGWLRDGLGLIGCSSEIEKLAKSVPDNGGVVFVPAFNGLGTPHWDQDARGGILGLTGGTTKAHLARATLESLALQVADVMDAMQADSGIKLQELRVDGGAAANDLLLQIQSDLLQVPVIRPKNTETTALGAAYLAGLAVGFFESLEQLGQFEKVDSVFEPQKTLDEVQNMRAQWKKAVSRVTGWAQDSEEE